MTPYYILRILPPIGDMTKYTFPDTQSLLAAIGMLRASLDIDKIEGSVFVKNAWRTSTDMLFQDCIIITRVDPELCTKHEDYFLNLKTEPKLSYKYRNVADEIPQLQTA